MNNVITEEKIEEILNSVREGNKTTEEFEESHSSEALTELKRNELIKIQDGKVKVTNKAKGKYFIGITEKSELPFFTDGDSTKFVPMWMAECLMDDYSFATHEETEELYVYENGIYKPKGKAVVRKETQRRLDEYVKTHYVNESLDTVRRANYTPPEKFNNPEDGIVVENGLLDIEKRILKSHSPEYVHLTKIPWKYDPEAECPKIKQFVSEVVNEGDEKLIQEMFGYCLLKDYPFAKAFMFLGSGANGKSTLLNLLKAFLGSDNIATPSLQDLLKDKFAKIQLFGKLANIHADLSSEKLEKTGTFKMLTGSDTIYGQKKFQDPIQFENHAKLLYSANELPKTDDRTEAFFRRWIVVDFPNHFAEGEADDDLPEKLINEEEMSGLLNWAIDGLKRIKEEGKFSQTESRQDIKQKWIMQTDSLRAFLDIACETNPDGYVAKKDFYEAYKAFCNENSLYTVKKGQVTKRIPSLEPQVSLYRPKIDGEQVRAWRNLQIKEAFIKEHEYIQDIQPLRTLSIARAGVTINKTSEKKSDMSDMSSFTTNKSKKQTILSQIPDDDKIKTSLLIDRIVMELDCDDKEAEKMLKKLQDTGDIVENPAGHYRKL